MPMNKRITKQDKSFLVATIIFHWTQNTIYCGYCRACTVKDHAVKSHEVWLCLTRSISLKKYWDEVPVWQRILEQNSYSMTSTLLLTFDFQNHLGDQLCYFQHLGWLLFTFSKQLSAPNLVVLVVTMREKWVKNKWGWIQSKQNCKQSWEF